MQEHLLNHISLPSQEPFGPNKEACEPPHETITFIMHRWEYKHNHFEQLCNLTFTSTPADVWVTPVPAGM